MVDLRSSFTGKDRWSFKPGLVSLLTVTALNLLCSLPGSVSFLLIPLSLLGYSIALIAILAITIYFVIKKRPRRGASVVLVVLLPVLLWSPIIWATDLTHLGITAGLGIGQLGVSKSNRGDFTAYDWSVGFAGSNTFLIRDVTDEIALPMARHTHPASSENDFEEECVGKVRHLVSHYYICSF